MIKQQSNINNLQLILTGVTMVEPEEIEKVCIEPHTNNSFPFYQIGYSKTQKYLLININLNLNYSEIPHDQMIDYIRAYKSYFYNLENTHNPYFLKYYGIYYHKQKKSFYLVYEHPTNLDIQSYVSKNNLDYKQNLKLFYQILNVFVYFYDNNKIYPLINNKEYYFIDEEGNFKILYVGNVLTMNNSFNVIISLPDVVETYRFSLLELLTRYPNLYGNNSKFELELREIGKYYMSECDKILFYIFTKLSKFAQSEVEEFNRIFRRNFMKSEGENSKEKEFVNMAVGLKEFYTQYISLLNINQIGIIMNNERRTNTDLKVSILEWKEKDNEGSVNINEPISKKSSHRTEVIDLTSDDDNKIGLNSDIIVKEYKLFSENRKNRKFSNSLSSSNPSMSSKSNTSNKGDNDRKPNRLYNDGPKVLQIMKKTMLKLKRKRENQEKEERQVNNIIENNHEYFKKSKMERNEDEEEKNEIINLIDNEEEEEQIQENNIPQKVYIFRKNNLPLNTSKEVDIFIDQLPYEYPSTNSNKIKYTDEYSYVKSKVIFMLKNFPKIKNYTSENIYFKTFNSSYALNAIQSECLPSNNIYRNSGNNFSDNKESECKNDSYSLNNKYRTTTTKYNINISMTNYIINQQNPEKQFSNLLLDKINNNIISSLNTQPNNNNIYTSNIMKRIWINTLPDDELSIYVSEVYTVWPHDQYNYKEELALYLLNLCSDDISTTLKIVEEKTDFFIAFIKSHNITLPNN